EEQLGYRAGYMAPESWRDPRAQRLNDVLSLFEDQQRWSPAASSAEARFAESWNRFSEHFAVFRPSDDERSSDVAWLESLLGDRRSDALAAATLQAWSPGSRRSDRLLQRIFDALLITARRASGVAVDTSDPAGAPEDSA